MADNREPNIDLDEVYQVIEEHTEMLQIRTARIITPKGYEPTEVWALWEETRNNDLNRICRTRGYITKNRKYIGFDNEWEPQTKHFTFAYSEDSQMAAFVAESRELGDYRDLIQIVSTRFNKAVLSIVLDDRQLHGAVYLTGPSPRMRFSRDNRKLLYFTRPAAHQYDTDCDRDRKFIMCIYDFDTEKVALVTDERLCCDWITAIEWTPDGRGIVYYQGGDVFWHRFGENYHNKILSDLKEPLRMTFSPDGSQLAVFLRAEELTNHSIILYQWPLVRAATSKHDVITLDPYRMFSVPDRPWAHDGKQLVFNAIHQTEVRVCVLNVEKRTVASMPFSRPGTVVDVRHDEMLLETKSGNHYSRLWVSSVDLETAATETASCLVSQKPDVDRLLNFFITEHHFDDNAYSGVFVYPPQSIGVDLSLVVMPFWGPDPYYTLNHRDPVVSTLVNMGYCVLIVNYRKPYVEMFDDKIFPTASRPEHIVDTHNAVVKILEEYPDLISKDHVYLYGQMFGSFIACCLVIKQPNFYKRCVLVRPILEFPEQCVQHEPLVLKVEPHLFGNYITTPIMMVIEEDFKKYTYKTFENTLKFNKVPFVKVSSRSWPDERFIRDVIDFFQNLLGDETD